MTEQIQSNPEVDEVTAPLTDWKNPPLLKDLKQDLQDAGSSHNAQKAKIREWLDNLHVEGKAKVNTPEGSSKIVPKLIRKQAEWRYSALSEPFLSTDDVFKINPVTWEDREAAQQNQLVLNNQFNTQLDKVGLIDEYVRTGVDEGTIIVRVGWEFQEESYKGTFPVVQYVVDPAFAPTHEYIAQIKAENPAQFMAEVPEELRIAHRMTQEQGQSIRPDVLRYEEQTRKRTLVNRPIIEICDYRNVIVDPTCQGNYEKATFIGYSFESSHAELKKDGKYKNLDKIVIASADSPLNAPDHDASQGSQTFNFKDEPRRKLVVHEYWGYWDIHGDGTLVPFVAAWVGNTLIRMEESPYPDKKLPFVIVQYLPVRKSVYGEPDGSLLEDNQKVIGAITRGMIDLMARAANSQRGTAKGMLDITNKRKFDKGQDYEFNPQMNPQTHMYMHEFPEIPQSAVGLVQMQNQEAESLTGVKTWNEGISGNALGDVAAGVRGVLDAASKRELGILRRLCKGIIQIGRKIISMNSEFLDEDEVVRITNDEFVAVRRDDLAGNFDLQLKITTAEEDNAKAQELAFMFQTNGPNGDLGMNKMIMSDIARLRKMPDLAHKIETYEPQPDPLAARAAEADVMLKEAQAMEKQAAAQERLTQARLNAVKVQSELSKANLMDAQADRINLDFVETESGVTQERDLEKQGAQARAQGQSKLVEIAAKRQSDREKLQGDLVKEYIKSRNQKKAV